jgi:thymidylate kinase
MNVIDQLRTSTVSSLAADVARAAHMEGLSLCHWKSNQRLLQSVEGKSDLDFSIPPSEEAALKRLLRSFGFVEFRSRLWQRYPGVTDWLGLDQATGAMLHVHLHNRLLTGAKAVKEQDLPWLELMNAGLQQDSETGLWVPSRAFEAQLFFTREAIKSRNLRGRLLGLRRRLCVSEAARAEMTWLLSQCSQRDLDDWGRKLWGDDRWSRMSPDFRNERIWQTTTFEKLRHEVASALSEHRHGNALKHGITFLTMRLIKRIHGLEARLVGTTGSGKHIVGRRAPIIALVGSDGAGKSTVASDLIKWLSWKADVAPIYFGTNHAWFRALRSVVYRIRPSGKPPSHRRGTEPKASSFPLGLQAFKWAFMSRLRLHLLHKAQRLAKNGTIVVADRYPQTEVFGTYDGPSRLGISKLGILGRALQRYEHRNFAKMEHIRPDLVIKLVAPLDMALARKPDHDPTSIARKIDLTRQITFEGASVVEVDASLPLAAVVMEVRRHVWTAMRSAAEVGDAIH